MSTQSARPGWITVLRDVVSYLIGVALLAKQAGIVLDPPAAPNDTLIWIGAILIGVPGALQVLTWRFGGMQPAPSSPAGQPSSSPPLPSPNGGAGE